MALLDALKRFSLPIGITAMILLVIGTFMPGGSLQQKVLFVIGAPTLGLTAYLNKQKMFTVLQAVVTMGAILGFFSTAPAILRYAIMLGSAALGIGYLIKVNYSKEDKWWPIGGLGLLGFAFSFATNAIAYPVMFNLLIIIGGILMAIYSAIGLFKLKVKIAAIWLILNILLIINPLRLLLF